MGAIIPAILPTSREDLAQKLLQLRGITDEVQVDFVDGKFAAPASWPHNDHTEPPTPVPELESFRYEADLMVNDPETAIGQWVARGASRITVHVASAASLNKIVEDFSVRYGHDKAFAPHLLSFGLAIGIDTDLASIEPYLDHCDYVQFMGIATIGRQGEPFDMRVIERIHAFHRKHPDVPIQVDGAVSLSTAPKLLAAGASRLVVGSALWKAGDIAGRFHEFTELTHQYGLYT